MGKTHLIKCNRLQRLSCSRQPGCKTFSLQAHVPSYIADTQAVNNPCKGHTITDDSLLTTGQHNTVVYGHVLYCKAQMGPVMLATCLLACVQCDCSLLAMLLQRQVLTTPCQIATVYMFS